MASEPEVMFIYAAQLRRYVKQYSAAESLLEEKPDLLLPRTQIRGQLLELALKAYLATCGVYREGHDLNTLADQACEVGLVLTEVERNDRIPNLNRSYYYHEGRDHKYSTRYPDPVPRMGAWVLPDRTPYVEMIQSIVKQTKDAIDKRPV